MVCQKNKAGTIQKEETRIFVPSKGIWTLGFVVWEQRLRECTRGSLLGGPFTTHPPKIFCAKLVLQKIPFASSTPKSLRVGREEVIILETYMLRR
jgi:hypothetical protein